MAELSVGDRNDALDVVQDAMMGLAERYADREPAEWPALFHRVLASRIADFHRRGRVRRRFRVWLGRGADPDEREDPIERQPDPADPRPERSLAGARAGAALDAALAALPARQREAFLLRVWEGLDVADTARAMGVSEGSVKTHLSRAMQTLRERLRDHYEP